ncbi:hypothetical protein ACTU45_27320 [Streptomyces sp. 24-1644]|uniref:hypothetical protein n=1 Tax=Streptomyces sp. 24-1644 TaxID=3457315 RepID=UPI003FA7420D
MGRHTELIRAKVMRADGAALGDERLKAEGQRYQAAGRTAEAQARGSRHGPGS